MTTNSTFVEKKSIEETAHDIGVAIGKGAEKTFTTVKSFGDGVRKGLEENGSLEKMEDVKVSVIEGVKEGAEKVGKAAEAFGDGMKKGIDDAKPLEEQIKDAGEDIAESVVEGVDNLKNDVDTELEKIEKNLDQ